MSRADAHRLLARHQAASEREPMGDAPAASTAAPAAASVSQPPDDELAETDAALAAAFALDHSDRLQFDHRRRQWMICDARSAVWTPDQSGAARRMLQEWAERRAFDRISDATSKRDLAAVRAAARHALSARGIRDALDLATFQAPLANSGEAWDSNPHVLGTAGGQLIDLRSGAVRNLRPSDRVTKAAAVPLDPAARCDRFRQFVTEVMDDDATLVALLRSALGYSVTGAINEQVFLVAIGSGANGKSTLLELLAYVLGDLAGVLPFGVLTRDRDSRAVQAEIADLPGARFVRASEVREGAHLDEGRIKSLTGGDPISAARKFGHPFTYRPEFKLWLGVNHRPRVTDRSHGFWRRAVPIPFRRTFAVDKALEPRLRDEAPGILTWLVEASADWYRAGLPRTAAADAVRADWRDGEDVVGQWAASALIEAPGAALRAAHAFEAFNAWADGEGISDRERPGARSFGEWLTARFTCRRTKTGKVYGAELVTGDGCDGSSGNLAQSRTRGELLQDTQHHPSPVTRPGGFGHV